MTHRLLLILALALAACAAPATPAPAATPTGPLTLTLMTHNSFAVSDAVLKEFEAAHNVKVQLLKSSDAGILVNTALLNKAAPAADVLYGVDNTLLSRALDGGLFDQYNASALAAIPDAFKQDPQNRALPVDYGDVCLNYDKAYFADHNLPPPATLADLTQPQYKSLLVVEDPALSSTGLAFMLATAHTIGAQGFADYWAALHKNDVKVDPDWETAYYTDFSGSSGKGSRPIVVSYASSPPAEVYFAAQPPAEAPTASVTGPGTCFRQIEFVGILHGTPNRDLAEAWIDFMLGKTFQEDMPLNMFVYPVLPTAALPDVFVKYAAPVESPVVLSAQEIADTRDALLRQWADTMTK